MIDGLELQYVFDSHEMDFDQDGHLDFQEYIDGTDPYVYNMDWDEYCVEFVTGFILGDFVEDTGSLATVTGQILGSLIPWIDIRDVAANLVKGDYLSAGLSLAGLLPAAGDLAKGAGVTIKFIGANASEIAKVSDLMKFVSAKFPDMMPLFKNSDEAVETISRIGKIDEVHLTKVQKKHYSS